MQKLHKRNVSVMVWVELNALGVMKLASVGINYPS
jgi:hypothetical protein